MTNLIKKKERNDGFAESNASPPCVGHAFMNAKPDPYESFEAREKSQGFAPYDETQANEAWKNVKTFFEKYV